MLPAALLLCTGAVQAEPAMRHDHEAEDLATTLGWHDASPVIAGTAPTAWRGPERTFCLSLSAKACGENSE